MATLAISVDDELLAKAKVFANLTGRSLSGLFRVAVIRYINEEEAKSDGSDF